MQEEAKKYQHSISFLRDFTHYTIPGVIFLATAYFIFPYSKNSGIVSQSENFYDIDGGFLSVSLIVVFSYFIGKLANSFTTPLFKVFIWIANSLKNTKFYKVMGNIGFLSDPIREYRRVLNLRDKTIKKYYEEHLFLEGDNLKKSYGHDRMYNEVLVYNQFLFSVRIERYNNISMYARSIIGLSVFTSLLSMILVSPFPHWLIFLICLLMAIAFYYIWLIAETTRLTALVAIYDSIRENKKRIKKSKTKKKA